MQPGETITPGGQPPAPPEPAPEQPAQVPQQSQQRPVQSQPPVPAPPNTAAESSWQFQAESSEDGTQHASSGPAVKWTASEYIAHGKSLGWYGLLALCVIAVVLLTFLITRELLSTGVVGVVGVMFGVFAARPPRTLEYAVDGTGIHVGPKFYAYGQFKTFSMMEEEAMRSIFLTPLQRFGMPLTIYYDPQDEEKIMRVLGAYLPYEDRRLGAIDNFMRKIRF